MLTLADVVEVVAVVHKGSRSNEAAAAPFSRVELVAVTVLLATVSAVLQIRRDQVPRSGPKIRS